MHKHLNNNNSTFHLHDMTTILSFHLYTEFRVFQNQDGYDFKVTKRRGMKICDVRFCVCVCGYRDNKASAGMKSTTVVKNNESYSDGGGTH